MMDINEKASLAQKCTFMDFLDQDKGQGVYMDTIRGMIAQCHHLLLIDMGDLRNSSYDLACRVIRSPNEYIKTCLMH